MCAVEPWPRHALPEICLSSWNLRHGLTGAVPIIDPPWREGRCHRSDTPRIINDTFMEPGRQVIYTHDTRFVAQCSKLGQLRGRQRV